VKSSGRQESRREGGRSTWSEYSQQREKEKKRKGKVGRRHLGGSEKASRRQEVHRRKANKRGHMWAREGQEGDSSDAGERQP
jgi:hypothetical protein